MQGLNAATLIAAAAMFAAIASTPALADTDSAMTQGATQAKYGTTDAGTPKLRWAAIAAEGERFHSQRKHNSAGTNKADAAKPRGFMAMAMAARESR